MTESLFEIVITIVYVIILVSGFLWYRHHKKINIYTTKAHDKFDRRNPNGTHKIKFSDIRRHKMRAAANDGYDTYTITRSFEEILNIFMSISPTSLQTILRVQEALILIQSEFEKPELDKTRIDELLNSILVALNQLEDASNTLIDKMVDVYYDNSDLEGEEKVDERLIDQYISIVNSLEEIHINYTYYFQRLLKLFNNEYKEKSSTFITISEKLIYVLYVVITCCSTRLDRHINAYRTKKGDS